MGKGSNRFSDAMRQTEGGHIDVILSKKMQTSTKRLNLPKKLFDDWHTVNLASVPRKLRSVLQKRRNEYVSQSPPRLMNRIHEFKWPLQDCNKKLKVYTDEHSKMAGSILEKISKNEEEAIAGLLALEELYPRNNKTNEINLNNDVSEASEPKDLVKTGVQIDVKKDSKDVTDGNKSRKRCSSHVYICQIIMDLHIKEDNRLNLLREPKTDISPENITNGNAGISLNEASTISETLFQDQARASGVQAYVGNPLCDPSQWSTPMFPKQLMWMNPFIPGAASYQNWQSRGREKIPPLSSSYAEASLQDVLVSKQQVSFRMQLGHCSSGYEENGGFPPTLKLTL